jgi:hypothetical protein
MIWNVETGNLIYKLELLRGVDRVGYAYSFISYDLRDNKTIKNINKFVTDRAFTKDSKYLLITDYMKSRSLSSKQIIKWELWRYELYL